jgi:predicted polyphosphate/ATP-dependent NAD kinase
MSLERFGFIVTGAGMDPAVHRTEIASDEFTSVMVGVTEPSQALSVARQMVEEGVQLIELCGGFGPVWTAAVEEAIDGVVPVGSVGYGPEAISGMHRLFPD